MPTEDHNSSDRSDQGLPQGGVELSLDELAKGLASGTLSRGKALKWMGGALVGAALAYVPGVAWANDRCPEGQTRCGERCVNLRTNERHCGRCRNRCRSNQTCCNGNCVNLQRSERHCGACGFRCPDEEECVDGVCEGGACAPPECGNFTPCAGDTCFCFEVTETPGQGRCLSDFPCDAVPCPNGTIDCPTGFTCVTNSCCGEGVQLCTAECSVGVTSQVGQGGGPTGSGVPH